MNRPEVCAVCLYADRPEFADRLLRSFRCQTYQHKWLLIYDNGREPFPLGLKRNEILITEARDGRTIGAMRNLATQFCESEILVHHDSDDWSNPTRIEDQVTRLLETGKAVTGYRSMIFNDGLVWFRYEGSPHYSLGTSLCYKRSWWDVHSFQANVPEEDNPFVADAWNANQLAVAEGRDMMFASIHKGNTSKKHISGSQWVPLPDSRHLFPGAFQMAGAAR